jgi:RimJ/RimL family protein N-acetyltransferase
MLEPRLESKRLLFRPLRAQDAAHLERLFEGDWEAIRQTGRMPYPPTADAMRAWIRGHAGPGSRSFLILRKDDQAVLGAIGFGGEGGTAELGYALGRAHWGRGYATEAVQAMVRLARERGLKALDAHIFTENPASARVLEKAGFVDLGLVERDYPKRGGRREVRKYRQVL